MDGRISIHRKIMERGWYSDTNTFSTFIHCLLKANVQDKLRHGIEIKRGSFITSIGNLSDEVGITRKQMLLVLERLEKGGEIVTKRDNKKTLFIVVKYNHYQGEKLRKVQQKNIKGTSKGYQRDTTKEDKNNKKEINNMFEDFWKTFPNRNSSNKKIAKENYMKSNLTDDEIMYEIKILNRMIEIGDKDPQYIKAFERWIRDITPTTPVLLENFYKSMILYLKKFNGEARGVISRRMKNDFGEDIIKQKRDQYGRDGGIVLKFKDDNGNVKVI